MMISKFIAQYELKLSDFEEDIVDTGENAGNKHFLLFQHCFQKSSLQARRKHWIIWK